MKQKPEQDITKMPGYFSDARKSWTVTRGELLAVLTVYHEKKKSESWWKRLLAKVAK